MRPYLHTVQRIHEQFVRLASASLSAYLRTPVQFTLDSLAQASSAAFMAGGAPASLRCVVSLDPLPAPIVVEVTFGVVSAALDRLLGGTGTPSPEERALTALEQALFEEHWLARVLVDLCRCWEPVARLTPHVRGVASGVEAEHVARPDHAVTVVCLEVTAGATQGTVRLSYADDALGPLLARSGERSRTNGEANVPVTVRLGTAEVFLEELFDLHTGDVIQLDTLVDTEVDILVGGRPRFRGCAGLYGRHLAVRVSASPAGHGDEPSFAGDSTGDPPR